MIDILSTLCQSSSYYEQNNYKSDVSQKFLLVLFLTIKETFSFFFFFWGGVLLFGLFCLFLLFYALKRKAEELEIRIKYFSVLSTRKK